MRFLRPFWLLLTYEMPKKPANLWRYQMHLVLIGGCSVWIFWSQPYSVWQTFLGGYCVARLYGWVAQHTRWAKPELME